MFHNIYCIVDVLCYQIGIIYKVLPKDILLLIFVSISTQIHTEYYYTVQCVDLLGCITSSCLCNVVSVERDTALHKQRDVIQVERDTALHKQRDVIQLTGSTHCSGIPFIIYIDKEDKTHLRTFRYFSFMFLNDEQWITVNKVNMHYRPRIYPSMHIMKPIYAPVVY